MRQDLLAQPELLGGGGEGEERARVAHREPIRAQVRLDDLGELQQAQAVGDAAAVALDALGQLFLRPCELGEQALIGLRLFHRVQVLAQQVLHQGQLEALRVGRLADDRGDPGEAGQLGGPPAPLAHDQLVTIAQAPYDNRLQDAALRQ